MWEHLLLKLGGKGGVLRFCEVVFRPRTQTIRLRRGHVYPTFEGICFFVVALVVVAFSINFASQNGYLFGFAIASVLISSIPLAFFNMANLVVTVNGCDPVFQGDLAKFKLTIENPSWMDRSSLVVRSAGEPHAAPIVDVKAKSRVLHEVVVSTKERGNLICPGLIFESKFPFGLFCVRVNWWPLASCIVLPQPELGRPTFQSHVRSEGDQRSGDRAEHEYDGVRIFQAGDSLKDIAWRRMAKENLFVSEKFLTKVFDGGGRDLRKFTAEQVKDLNSVDEKVSRLAGWIVDAESDGVDYAIELERISIPPGAGTEHLYKCLSALALVEVGDIN